jgi:hypothetical protein
VQFPFNAPFVSYPFQLLHHPFTSSHMHYFTSATTTSSLLYACSYSFYAPCACNVHNASTCSHCVHHLHISSALSDYHGNPSASLAVSHAFNITGCHAEIPQPLWQSRLFIFSVLDELILSVFSYRLQSPSICQSPVSIILNPLEDALRLFIFFGDHTQSSSSPLVEIIICFSCYTEKRKSSPAILFNFTCTVGLNS